MNYDAGMFHAGGFLAFYDAKGANNTVFEVGGRFYYHLHSTAMSDFGLGGSIGIANVDRNAFGGMAAESATLIFVEPGMQIRLFLASNVALSVAAGIQRQLVAVRPWIHRRRRRPLLLLLVASSCLRRRRRLRRGRRPAPLPSTRRTSWRRRSSCRSSCRSRPSRPCPTSRIAAD